jgi:hypothetical protein
MEDSVLRRLIRGPACCLWIFPLLLSGQDGRDQDNIARTVSAVMMKIEYCPFMARRDSRGRCADWDDRHKAAEQLIALGPAAAPAIAIEMDPKLRRVPVNIPKYPMYLALPTLVYAYAKLKGPEAVPLFQTLWRREQPLDAAVLDQGIAHALDYTSYVSAAQRYYPDSPRSPTFRYWPNSLLDHLFRAWEHGDLSAVRGDFSVNARALLPEDLLRGVWTSSWGTDHAKAAIGYRLLAAGEWAKPQDMFTDPGIRGPLAPDLASTVVFFDQSGRECGRQAVRFARPRGRYEIDTDEPAALLRLLARCSQLTAK